MDENLQAKVPDLTDPLLVDFSNRYQLQSAPVHLTFTDRGYPASQCHLSAKHCAMTHGGRRGHGSGGGKFHTFRRAGHHRGLAGGDQPIDVTPPKFGGDHILFVRDDVSDLIQMDSIFVMWCDRSTLAQAPFLFNNQAHNEATFGLAPNNAAITGFCAQYGLTPTDMLTSPTYG